MTRLLTYPCSSWITMVHHRSYNPDQLILLCPTCCWSFHWRFGRRSPFCSGPYVYQRSGTSEHSRSLTSHGRCYYCHRYRGDVLYCKYSTCVFIYIYIYYLYNIYIYISGLTDPILYRRMVHDSLKMTGASVFPS